MARNENWCDDLEIPSEAERSLGFNEALWLRTALRVLGIPPGRGLYEFYPEMEPGNHPGH